MTDDGHMFTQDKDLAYSLGKYKLAIEGVQTLPDGSMLLDLRIDDRYDFDELRDARESKGNFLNNPGVLAQSGSIPYDFVKETCQTAWLAYRWADALISPAFA